MRTLSPITLLLGVSIAFAFACNTPIAHAKEDTPVIENGKSVSIEYTLKIDDGITADTNVGGDPLVYEQGKQQILPALETALLGLAVGADKQVTLSPEDGYGTSNPDLVQTVPAEQIPEDGRHVGATLIAQSQDGQQRPIRVTEVRETEVVLDLNHPLAGQTLHFDVKVLAID